jgi:hypothetical protein
MRVVADLAHPPLRTSLGTIRWSLDGLKRVNRVAASVGEVFSSEGGQEIGVEGW